MELKHIIILGTFALAGCNREQLDDCVTSAGAMRTEERATGAITEVDLSDRIDLVIEARDANTISVEAGANLIAQVSTEMEGGKLTVRNDMRCNWVRSFKPRITVHVPASALQHVVLRGTGNITSTDSIRVNYFLLEQWGGEGSCSLLISNDRTDIALHTAAGDCTVHGACNTANLYSGIMAPLDASGLRARTVAVNNSGVSDVRCWAVDHLNVQLRDVGDVYYSGSPSTLETSVTGSGHLIHE
ncbi:MAG TPA: DUF2807 domain-containing protein [Flavobacteriales bacterium]|nr:DUF2807 domain-containing protein [Flavobacteriales bacterium]